MIDFLKGILHSKKPPQLTIELNGVGYECQAPMSTFYHLPEVGNEIFLHTHFAVREDAHTLYGFYHEQERLLFRSLIKISNVGPKLALGILSGIEPDPFVRCIKENDVAALTHIPGVGKKTAERLIVEMRDRLNDWGFESVVTEQFTLKDRKDRLLQDALSALVALGYKPQEASRLTSQVTATYNSTEELIRLALKSTLKGGKNDNSGSLDQCSDAP